MIDLYSANTPNGKKISIMLEEIGYEYKVINIDLNKGDQFKPEFKKISPFSKIPVIKDKDNNGNNVILGSGGVDFKVFFDELKKINYRYNYTFETTRGNNALKNADIAILDSGFFCILLRIFKREKIKKKN